MLSTKLSKIFIIISIFTCAFLLLTLYWAFFSGLINPVLPDRFTTSLSILFLILSVLIVTIAFLLFKQQLKIDFKLNKHIIALILFILAIAISAPLIYTVPIIPRSDYLTYYNLAVNLSNGGIYIPDYVSVFPHTIGFPFFLSLVLGVFGSSIIAAQIFGAVLSALSVVLVYYIGRKLSNEKNSIFAAILWLFMPSRILYSLLICTENLYNTLALVAVLVFLFFVQKTRVMHNFIYVSILGIIVAVLSAIRPNAVILLIALLIIYLLFYKYKGSAIILNSTITKIALSIILVAVYWISGTLITSAIEAKIDKEVASTTIGWNLFVGMNGDYNGRWNPEDADLFGFELKTFGSEGAQQRFLSMGLKRLNNHIEQGTLLKFLYYKANTMWYADHESFDYIANSQPENISTIFHRNNKLVKLICDGYYYVLLLLSLISIILHIKNKNVNALIFLGCLILLGTLAVHLPFEAALRYKNHVIIWLCFIAASTPEIKHIVPLKLYGLIKKAP